MNCKVLVPLIISIVSILNAQNFWQATNGPYTGTFQLIQSDTNGILFGARFDFDDTYLYKSENNGESWQKVTNIVRSPKQFKIAKSNEFYISSIDSLYKSDNNGENWISFKNIPFDIEIISFTLNNSNHIILGTSREGVLISRDGGQNWRFSNKGLIDSQQPEITVNFLKYKNEFLYALTEENGIYRSIDHGKNWMHWNFANKRAQLFSHNHAELLFAVVNDSLYRSIDNGNGWSLSAQGLELTEINDIEIIGSNEIYICGTGGLYKSNDGGSLWIKSMNGMTSNQNIVNAVQSTIDESVVACARYIVFKSDDHGLKWRNVAKGIKKDYISNIFASKTRYVLASTQSGGLYITNDEGQTWNHCNYNIDAANINTIIGDEYGVLFVGNNNGIYKSTNNGSSWEHVIDDSICGKIQNIKLDKDGKIYAGGSKGVFISDDGYSWVCNSTNLGWKHLIKIAIDDSGYIFVSSIIDGVAAFWSDAGIFRSKTLGNSWVLKFILYHHLWDYIQFDDIIVNKNNTLFFTANFENYGIMRSFDQGETWQNLYNNLPANQYYGFLYCDENNTIYTGSSGKLFYSRDEGDTWEVISDGVGQINVGKISANPDGVLFVATVDGVYKSTVPITSISEGQVNLKQTFELFQNYPNPFNQTTTIRFSLQKSSKVKLEIFDIIGQKILALDLGEHQAGLNEYIWNAKTLASGVYFIKMYLPDSNQRLIKKAIIFK